VLQTVQLISTWMGGSQMSVEKEGHYTFVENRITSKTNRIMIFTHRRLDTALDSQTCSEPLQPTRVA
jgi:hypothetical protein